MLELQWGAKLISSRTESLKMSAIVWGCICVLWVCLGCASQSLCGASPAAYEPSAVRIAVLKFAVDNSAGDIDGLGGVCESALMAEFASDRRYDLVDRDHVLAILAEHKLAETGGGDPLRAGHILGAHWLVHGRVQTNRQEAVVDASIIEVSSGNILLTCRVAATGTVEQTALSLVEIVRTNIPLVFMALDKDKGKPTATIHSVVNTSQLRRLDYLQPVVHQLLEKAIEDTGKFRLLRWQGAGLTRHEAELSFFGSANPSGTVYAQYADAVISATIQERMVSGQVYDETPVEFTVRVDYGAYSVSNIVVSGLAPQLDSLLVTLSERVRAELAGSRRTADDEKSRRLEAMRLKDAALGRGATKPEANASVRLLERALNLDPGLREARYWLAMQYSEGPLSSDLATPDSDMKGVPEMKAMARVAKEFEAYIRAEEGREGHASGDWMSKSKEMRFHAYSRLIWCYRSMHEFHRLRLTGSQKEAWSSVVSANDKRCEELFLKYLADRESWYDRNLDYFWWARFGEFHEKAVAGDPKPLIDWVMHVDGIVGKDHWEHGIQCPLLALAHKLMETGNSRQAAIYYARAMNDHGHKVSRKGADELDIVFMKSLEAAIEVASGRQLKDSGTGENMQLVSAAEQPRFYETMAWLPRTIMQEFRLPVDLGQEDVQIIAFGAGERYLYVVNERSGVGRLYRQRGDNVIEEVLIETSGAPFKAAVTSIVPLNEVIWVGTHDGLARFDPRANTWKWYGPREGLPTSVINCGVAVEGQLWFGGGEGVIFSFDPKSGKSRSYLCPDPVIGIGVKDRHAVVCGNSYAFSIDLDSGLCTNIVEEVGTDKRPYHTRIVPVHAGGWWLSRRESICIRTNQSPVVHSRFDTLMSDAPDRGNPSGLARRCPIPYCIVSVVRGGNLLWIASHGHGEVTAYDFAGDIWYGPLRVDAVDKLAWDGDNVWIINGGAYTRVKGSEFMHAAKAAGRCRTTAEFQLTVDMWKQGRQGDLRAK